MIKQSKNIYGEDMSNEKLESKEKVSMEFTDYQKMLMDEILNWEIDSEDGIIFITNEIEDGETTRLMKEVMYLRRVNPELKRLTLVINSPGGAVQDMLSIIDYIKSLDIPVDAVCRGSAMSAAALIFTCVTGKRYISKHSTLMYHESFNISAGKNRDVKAGQAYVDAMEEAADTLLAEHSNKDINFWKDAMIKDFYVSAEKAIELGVADHII